MSIAMTAVENQSSDPAEQREHTRPNGRVCVHGLSDTDRNFCLAMHLSPLVALLFPIAVFAPLVLWLIRKDQSAFVDDHGREVVNFLISFVVLHLLLLLAAVTVIGIPVTVIGIPTLWVVGIVNLIRGAVAAGRGEYFRFPMTIRFLT